jgi:hypothetical protein
MPMRVFKADWGESLRRVGPLGPAAVCSFCYQQRSWGTPAACKRPSDQSSPPAARLLPHPRLPPGGWQVDRETTCPPNYPPGAPLGQCGHFAFVEIDAAMAYRSAIAYVATSDERYARQAMAAVQAWATTNKEWGLVYRNGPLEAAWWVAGCGRQGGNLLRGLD